MGHGKLRKFAEMETFPNVVQETMSSMAELLPTLQLESDGAAPLLPPSKMQGKWGAFFDSLQKTILDEDSSEHKNKAENHTPIVLELGCGRGEYTVGLARMFPEKRFIGVDIKGARMWHGARQAIAERLTNVAFLRTNIEFIDRFFAQDEVSEIWLTFSDPQMKKPSKRLTSTYFLERYRKFLPDGGLVHLKTDSNFLFTYTRLLLQASHIEPRLCIDDIYADDSLAPALRDIQTYYEQMWLSRGIKIKYLSFPLPRQGKLVEPENDIPLDDYRSYNRHKRSSKTCGR